MIRGETVKNGDFSDSEEDARDAIVVGELLISGRFLHFATLAATLAFALYPRPTANTVRYILIYRRICRRNRINILQQGSRACV